MAAPRTRLTYLLGLGALALALPACSLPVYTAREENAPPAPVIVSAPWREAPPPAVPESAIRQAGAEQPAPDALPGPETVTAPDLIHVPAEGVAFREGEAPAEPASPSGSAGASPSQHVTASLGTGISADQQAEAPSDFWTRLDRDIDLSLQDYRNYYSLPNLTLLALGIGGMAPVANTPADRGIRHWIQQRVHSHGESLAEFFNYGGQLWVALPVGLEIAALCGKAPEDYATDGGLFEWSNRSLRAIAVGFPPVLAGYALLGAARPNSGDDSRWHPFEHFHGMSGHTFIGAVPFLTAASMTDNPWIKYPLFFGSFMTGCARLYEDRHYFSQVALGWWCAFLAVHSVNQTEDQRRSFTVVPMVMPGGAGMGVEWRY